MTHTRYLSQVAVRVRPQHLDCYLPSLIFPLQHIPKPTATVRDIHLIVGQFDLELFRKQIVLATNLKERPQAFLSDRRKTGEGVEHLSAG